eukprot:g18134.t1
MPSTNYDKWNKFAADLDSDSSGEDTSDYPREYLAKSHSFLLLPPQPYIPGGKKKLCCLMEEVEDEIGSAVLENKEDDPLHQLHQNENSKTSQKPKPFTVELFDKEQGRHVEIDPDTNERISKDPAELMPEHMSHADALAATKRQKKLKLKDRFQSGTIGSTFLPGYNLNSKSQKLWKVYYDDCFLQIEDYSPNPAARALIGTRATGWFVVCCYERVTRDSAETKLGKFSKKDVADLIYARGEGKDAGKIELEIAQSKAQQENLEGLGMKFQSLA